MSFLRTPDESPLYDTMREQLGYLPNYARMFAIAPEAFAAWLQLSGAVKKTLEERRYELVTWVAARALSSRYCALAHADVLLAKFFDARQLTAIAEDRHGYLSDPPADARLDPADVAAMDFAERIATDPRASTEDDIATLRGHGLGDEDIMAVILTVTMRRFFAGTLDAAGATPDGKYDDIGEALVQPS